MTQTTVYLIDDEPQLLAVLVEMVELSGLEAQGYTQAHQFFKQVTVFEDNAILILDLNMPEMDGIEVMRHLANTDNPPALILISGHDAGVLRSAEKLGKAHNLEILASMSKPVPLDEFQRVLESHATSSRSHKPTGATTAKSELTKTELVQAILDNQLILHYQPQYEIATATLTGVEALVRWQHPDQGLIYPDRFIPLAEQSGIVAALTHWVIDKAVKQEQQWQDAGFSVTVSVNISAVDITSLTLPEQLAELLQDNRLDATRLNLEVTESALMGELVTSLDILTRLRLKGVGLSIDDFGTGYSSLSHLHRVPFTELKIDRSFVSNMSEDAEARAIVKTCIFLGHDLDMRVVAEGVETEADLDLLKQMGCDIAQGYLFSRPVSAEEVTELMQKM